MLKMNVMLVTVSLIGRITLKPVQLTFREKEKVPYVLKERWRQGVLNKKNPGEKTGSLPYPKPQEFHTQKLYGSFTCIMGFVV